MATQCARCGTKGGIMAVFSLDLGGGQYYCPKCEHEMVEERIKAKETEKQRIKQLMQISQKVVLTTTPGIDGHRIKKYLGIESVEFVIGTGVFSEITTSLSDFIGARSTAFEKKLREAKQHALDALKFLAAEKGANAVVAIDLDYSEFSGNRIALIVNGTLVLAEPFPDGT